MEPARLGELGQLVRDRVQSVVRDPAAVAVAPLEVQLVAHLAQAERAERIVLFDIGHEPQRLDEGVAEPDIDQPRLVERHTQGEMIESRAEAALGLVAARLEQIHLEPDRTQQDRERAIEFVADPAPALDAELADEPIRVQLDRFAEEDAGVLERHGPQVRPMQGGQRRRGRRAAVLATPRRSR